jgi:hypothetical protein
LKKAPKSKTGGGAKSAGLITSPNRNDKSSAIKNKTTAVPKS